MKNIAVQGCTLSEATAQITTPASTKVKFDGKGAYSGSLTITITGYSDEKGTITGGAGSGSLSPSAQKVKIEGQAAVLEGDSVTVTVTGTNPSTGATVQVPVNVEIKNAGQTKVQGA